MVTRKGWACKLCVVAALALTSSFVGAFMPDEAKILINRTLTSPTITVRYMGAKAALAELKVNGVSYGTRNLNSAKSSGETNFTLDLSTLKPGDNEIVINLFDKSGKLVATQKQAVATELNDDAPVFIRAPKVGATVQGPVEIKVGFGRDFKNSYVSFFIDNQFRSMSNLAPYSYLWDTEREINGWHDLEAWVVDENNQTLKTHKVRVFVNNPGGATARKTTTPKKPIDLNVAGNSGDPALANPAGSKPVTGGSNLAGANTKPMAPKVSPAALDNEVKLPLANPRGSKAPKVDNSVASSAKLMTPTGKRVANRIEVKSPVASIKNAGNAVGLIRVAKGTKLPDAAAFSILLNDKFVDFDVQPRVENGVPLTPFRHLIEQAGGEVKWKHDSKSVDANAAGQNIFLQIGDVVAKINNIPVELELAPFVERGRTIVPLSFIKDALKVEVEYDKATGHVLITQAKKN